MFQFRSYSGRFRNFGFVNNHIELFMLSRIRRLDFWIFGPAKSAERERREKRKMPALAKITVIWTYKCFDSKSFKLLTFLFTWPKTIHLATDVGAAVSCPPPSAGIALRPLSLSRSALDKNALIEFTPLLHRAWRPFSSRSALNSSFVEN